MKPAASLRRVRFPKPAGARPAPVSGQHHATRPQEGTRQQPARPQTGRRITRFELMVRQLLNAGLALLHELLDQGFRGEEADALAAVVFAEPGPEPGAWHWLCCALEWVGGVELPPGLVHPADAPDYPGTPGKLTSGPANPTFYLCFEPHDWLL